MQVVQPRRAHHPICSHRPEHQIRRGSHVTAPRGTAHQGIRQAGDPLQTQPLMHNRPPKVCVDEQYPLPFLGEHDRQIGDTGTLAFAKARAGEEDGFDLPIHAGELNIRPQRPQTLGQDRLRID